MPEKFHVVGVGRQPAAGKPSNTPLKHSTAFPFSNTLRQALHHRPSPPRPPLLERGYIQVCRCPARSLRAQPRDAFAAVSGAGSDEFFAKCSFIHANYDSAADFAVLSQHCAAIEDEMCVNCIHTP